MGANSVVDEETMYTTWVACNRNAAEAAKRLGLTHGNMRYHVSSKNWNDRYAVEYSGTALAVRKMAMLQAAMQTPKMLEILIEIAEDGSQPAMARVAAVRDFFKITMPPEPARVDSRGVSVVEAAGVVLENQEPEQVEVQIREMLEANIIGANEQRTRKAR